MKPGYPCVVILAAHSWAGKSTLARAILADYANSELRIETVEDFERFQERRISNFVSALKYIFSSNQDIWRLLGGGASSVIRYCGLDFRGLKLVLHLVRARAWLEHARYRASEMIIIDQFAEGPIVDWLVRARHNQSASVEIITKLLALFYRNANFNVAFIHLSPETAMRRKISEPGRRHIRAEDIEVRIALFGVVRGALARHEHLSFVECFENETVAERVAKLRTNLQFKNAR